MSIDLSRFHKTFIDEAREGLDQIEAGVLALEEGATDEALNAIFRAAHSIKGGAATFGFGAVADLTHHLETILDRRRQGSTATDGADSRVDQPSPELIEVLLASVDCLRAMFDGLEFGEAVDAEQVAELIDRLERMAAPECPEASASPAEMTTQATGPVSDLGPSPALEPAPTFGSAASPVPVGGPETLNCWRISVVPDPGIFLTGNDPARLLEELGELGPMTVTTDLSRLPSLEDLDPEMCYLHWTVELQLPEQVTTEAAEAAIREVFEWVEDDVELTIVGPTSGGTGTGGSMNDRDPEPAQKAKPDSSGGPVGPTRERRGTAEPVGASIRVDIDKVDKLINLVGELVITQSMLQELTESDRLIDRERLREGLADLEAHTRDLQGSVLQVRMLPIDVAFSRLRRLVRDLSSRLGKQVDLVFEGEATELDKTVLEKIGDPLVHLVRNSLDHGIETPEERRASNKPETGTLSLSAQHDGGSIVVSVTDDGAGLDHDRILAKARQVGLVGDDEELSVEQIQRLIFRPGLTTAASVSEVSGRGVGMDVVRRNVTDLGGDIDVSSTRGVGTTFSIRLPLTLAIVDGQLVRVGGDVFVVPLLSIVESLQFDPSLASSPSAGVEVYRHREQAIPLIDLRQTLDLRNRRSLSPRQLVVVIEVGGTRVGLLVDELLSQQQIVIKSLTTNFRRVPGLSGATILGDGTVAMILDANGLVGIYRSKELEVLR